MSTMRYADCATVQDVLDDIEYEPDWECWQIKQARNKLFPELQLCILPEAVKMLAWELAYNNEHAEIDVRLEMMTGEEL